jgi:hypothetical protein
MEQISQLEDNALVTGSPDPHTSGLFRHFSKITQKLRRMQRGPELAP